MISKAIPAFLIVFLFFGFACKSEPEAIPAPDYNRPLPLGASGLRKITDPAEIPDFTPGCFDLYGLHEGIANSLNFLAKPSSQNFYPYDQITHEHAIVSLEAFYELLESGLTGDQLNAEIRQRFDVYTSVGYDDQGTVLFTGYYTPIFNGSLQPDSRFQYPLYRQPDDLIKSETGEILGRRRPDGSLTPFPSRRELETSSLLAGYELIWLEDAFEVYVAHVQGSAIIRLPDGNTMTVGYAASNGHEYHSVRQEMIDDGLIEAERLNLSSMIDYFKANPGMISVYTRRNPRFVFFTESEDHRPHGSINEPVITLRTIATDKTVFPPAAVTFIVTQLPRTMPGGGVGLFPYSGFALDQDTGGAIRAAGRCDVYLGIGDEAGQLAGATYQEGRLYYLFLKQ